MILTTSKLFAAALLLVIISACVSTAWKNAVKGNSIAAYENFLRRYPQSEFDNEARRKLEAFYFYKAKNTRTIGAYEEFIAKYPQGHFILTARKELEDLKEEMRYLRPSYEEATKQNSIKNFSEYVRHHYQSPFVEEAISGIWNILSKRYPGETYTRSTSLTSLKVSLPQSIALNKAFLVAVSPRIVYGTRSWRWTTKFIELAGHPITLDSMSPRIVTPHRGEYGLPSGSDAMIGTVHIRAFGTGSHSWQCSGDLGGSLVILRYQHGIVSSDTTLK